MQLIRTKLHMYAAEQHNLLKYVLNRYPHARVVAATDHDEQGEKFADIICSIRPDTVRTIPPTGKDWNDTLRTQTAKNESRCRLTHNFATDLSLIRMYVLLFFDA